MESAENDKPVFNPFKGGRYRSLVLPVDLNIRKFKKHIAKEYPQLTKSERNYLAKRYKEGAWRDFHDMVKNPYNYPTHVVKDTTNEEQKTDIPVA